MRATFQKIHHTLVIPGACADGLAHTTRAPQGNETWSYFGARSRIRLRQSCYPTLDMSAPDRAGASQAPDSKINAEDGRKYWQGKVRTSFTPMLMPLFSCLYDHTGSFPPHPPHHLPLIITRELHCLHAIETN